MKYIDKILSSSNNELQFAEKLKEIKHEITSENAYRNINLFVKNLNEYCNKEIQESKAVNSDYILLNTNHFCMHILQRLVKMMEDDHHLHKEAMKRMLRVTKLDRMTEEGLKQTYIERICMCLTSSFTDETGYLFEEIEYSDTKFFEVFNLILNSFNLDIIYEIVGTKPIIFLGIEGKKSAILTGANVYLYMIKDVIKYQENGELDINSLYSRLLNNLTETTVRALFDNLLGEYEKDMICQKYNLDTSNVENSIGRDIVHYLMEGTETRLLTTIRMLVKNAYLPEEQVIRKIHNIQDNVHNKFKTVDPFHEFDFDM